MRILYRIIPMMINIDFNITELATDFQSCQKSCDSLNGYIPFFSEVGLIHNKLYTNGSLARKQFSIFNDKRRIGLNDKDLRFFISTRYDYSKNIWKSGFFKIAKNDWDTSKKTGYRFPIEGGGF